MNTDIKSFLINIAAGLFTTVVFLYLDKTGFTSPAYIVFVLYIALLVLVGYRFHFAVKKRHDFNTPCYQDPKDEEQNNIVQTPEDQLLFEVLFHILQIKASNGQATPRIFATAIDTNPDRVLSQLKDLHDDQFVTYQSGGLPPTLDTDFFLSPKAFEVIRIEPA